MVEHEKEEEKEAIVCLECRDLFSRKNIGSILVRPSGFYTTPSSTEDTPQCLHPDSS